MKNLYKIKTINSQSDQGRLSDKAHILSLIKDKQKIEQKRKRAKALLIHGSSKLVKDCLYGYHYHLTEVEGTLKNTAKKIKVEMKRIYSRSTKEVEITRELKGFNEPIFYGYGVGVTDAYRNIKKVISKARQQRKYVGFVSSSIGSIKGVDLSDILQTYPKEYSSSHVHVSPGQILEAQLKLKSREVFNPKKPSPYSKDNYVGIELEFFFEGEEKDLAKKLLEKGLEKNVHVKNDGSIRVNKNSEIGKELAILATEDKIFDVIERVTSVLKELKASVNNSCGMHVHLDARNRDHKEMFYNLTTHLNILSAMQPKSRQDNTYCKKNTSKHFDKERGNRYKAVNANAYSKYSTIEVRLHSGTVDKTKITNWVKLLLTIVNSRVHTKRAVKLDTFFKTYALDAELRTYVQNRISRFKGEVHSDDELNNEPIASPEACPF